MDSQQRFDLVIVGAGGFAREVCAWLPEVYSAELYRFKGFLGRQDDSSAGVLADPLKYLPAASDRFVLAIGDLDVRQTVIKTLEAKGARFLDFVHPQSHIAPTTRMGRGVVIYPFALTSHAAVLGDFVHLSLYASVGHDAATGDNCYLAPYATLNGQSRVGDNVLLGSHATVASRVSVGNNSRVAANSAVMRDTPENSIVFGVPGKHAPRIGDARGDEPPTP